MATKAHRYELHEKLCEILGSRNVYFQPPSNSSIKYPCIVYHQDVGRNFHADNTSYLFVDSYQVTVIDKDPDTQIPDKLQKSFPMIRRSGPYRSDNLNHYPFLLYY